MNSKKILYSKGRNDENYTPKYAVEPLISFIPNNIFPYIIWCPFDKADSEFVKLFEYIGYTVIHSHIDNGQDFYEYEPKEWDVIISNPPFTKKRQIFERALSFNKPFALLMTNTWLNDSAPKQLFKDKELQLLMFDKRIDFDGQKKITFSSSYYCYNFLPKQIIMEELLKNNNMTKQTKPKNEIVSIGDEFRHKFSDKLLDDFTHANMRLYKSLKPLSRKKAHEQAIYEYKIIEQFIINKITAIRDEVVGKKDICDNGWNDYRQEIIEIFNKHLK